MGLRRPARGARRSRARATGSRAIRRSSTTATRCRWCCSTRPKPRRPARAAACCASCASRCATCCRATTRAAPGSRRPRCSSRRSIPTDRLLADVREAALVRAFLADDPLPRSERAFAEQVKRARARLPAVMDGAFRLLATIAAEYQALTQRLGGARPARCRAWRPRCAASATRWCIRASSPPRPWEQLQHLPRYLKALDRRVAKFAERPDRDAPPRGAGCAVLGRATSSAPSATSARPARRTRGWRSSAGCSRSCASPCSPRNSRRRSRYPSSASRRRGRTSRAERPPGRRRRRARWHPGGGVLQ